MQNPWYSKKAEEIQHYAETNKMVYTMVRRPYMAHKPQGRPHCCALVDRHYSRARQRSYIDGPNILTVY